MSNQLLIDELQQSPYCNECGSEFITQADVDELIYLSSSPTCDWYLCPDCGTESIQIQR